MTDRSPDGAEPLLLVPSYVGKLAPPGSETPPNKEATESSYGEPWPANAGALFVKGNERGRTSFAKTRTPPESESRRGPGNPHGGWVFVREFHLGKHVGAVNIPHGTSGTHRDDYPLGGSLCISSGHSLSTTARISSEMTVTFSMSCMYLCNRRKSAGVITLPPTIRGK